MHHDDHTRNTCWILFFQTLCLLWLSLASNFNVQLRSNKGFQFSFLVSPSRPPLHSLKLKRILLLLFLSASRVKPRKTLWYRNNSLAPTRANKGDKDKREGLVLHKKKETETREQRLFSESHLGEHTIAPRQLWTVDSELTVHEIFIIKHRSRASGKTRWARQTDSNFWMGLLWQHHPALILCCTIGQFVKFLHKQFSKT